ncbi:GDSL-type esterase/lipase family protein [Massilia sp. DJPM01]|uniref:GDSL-type esterase/lipase family protein n=1 Tax=Massilia sp. DJPM01 TaxID=3024404 RepID=UPI00259DA6CB|nr:GDSL-type esterase/lipase family protein [Massilia sp. DJPM01]MDM5177289.1 GDSL-type esterase/lipase family protein [Massilia sp. DJPM01]
MSLVLYREPAAAAPVAYLAGDSTVASYGTGNYPQQGWGGRIRDYLTTGITVDNRAIGGRSSKSFVDEGRLSSILSVIKPGDYLFVQFGHNDGYGDPRLHTDPYTSFKTYLAMYVDLSRQYGAIPVLVTPMGRRRYNDSGRFINDFADRAAAMKQLASEKNVPLIDLNAKSIAFYDGVGVAATADVFLWLAANEYPRFPNGVSDDTHFQEYGAGQLARLVVQGIEESRLAMRSFIGAVGYPAEAAVLTGTGTVRARNYTGWQGKGYVDFPQTGGTMTLNNVIGKAGGTHTLRIRFANGAAAPRTGQLVVNGVAIAISFNATGSWNTWANKEIAVTLRSGAGNKISLRSIGGDMANIDGITVL